MQWTSETLNSMCLNRISLMVGHKTEQHEWSNDNSNHSGFVHSDIIIILHSVCVFVCFDINCCRTGQKSEPKIKRRCSRIVKKKPLVFIHRFLINALNWMRNRTIRSVNEFSCSFHLSLLHFPENLVLNLRMSCEFQFKVVEKRAQFNICTHHYSVSRKYLHWIPGFCIQNILWYREQCFAGNECVNNWK